MFNLTPYIKKAIKEATELEPWKGYYLIRGVEIENLFLSLGLNNTGKVLEVGCGNGFFSYLVSFISEKVIATDLYTKNAKTHTPGIDSARQLISKIGNKNIFLSACSIEHIPFKDNTFDIVFSAYTLHYINDRTLGLNEIKRVVKKDGIVIIVVPNFIERIYSFFQFYLYFVIKILGFIFIKTYKIKNISSGSKSNSRFSMAKFRENYRYFPFPGPHGAYKNGFIEMIRHMPHRWNREFKEAGFKFVHSLTTAFIPYPLLLTISSRMTYFILFLFKKFTRTFGDKPFLKYLGYNYCVILKK